MPENPSSLVYFRVNEGGTLEIVIDKAIWPALQQAAAGSQPFAAEDATSVTIDLSQALGDNISTLQTIAKIQNPPCENGVAVGFLRDE